MRRIAGLAAIPSRAGRLERVVMSLLGQMDVVGVAFNGYEKVPGWFLRLAESGRAQFTWHKRTDDPGDAAKFDFIPADPAAVYFSCDDDLIYPPDYAEVMTDWLERTKGRAIVSAHGGVIPDRPSKWAQGRAMLHCLREVSAPHWVNCIGTGVAAFPPSLRPPHEAFGRPTNMADLWVSKWAGEQRVPLLVVPHAEDWLALLNEPREETLYRRSKREGGKAQLALLQERAWPIHRPGLPPAEPIARIKVHARARDANRSLPWAACRFQPHRP